MEELNPKSRKELREEEEIRRFLAGDSGAHAGASRWVNPQSAN